MASPAVLQHTSTGVARGDFVVDADLWEDGPRSLALVYRQGSDQRQLLKTWDKRGLSAEAIQREVRITKMLQGNEVFAPMDAVFEAEDAVLMTFALSRPTVLMDSIEGDIGTFSEDAARALLLQLLAVVKGCHGMGVALGAVQLDRVLRQGERLFIIHFADARFCQVGEQVGPLAKPSADPVFVAPEVLAGRPWGHSADLWSCGVLLYQLLSGACPFLDPSESCNPARAVEFPPDEFPSLSSAARDLMTRLLAKDPADRQSLAALLAHPWLGGVGDGPVDFGDPIAQRLRQHAQLSALGRATLKSLAGGATDDELEGLRRTFLAFDTDCDGEVSLEELRGGLLTRNSCMGGAELEDLVRSLSSRGVLSLTLDDFVAAMMSRSHLRRSSGLEQVFRQYDHDEDGVLTKPDLHRALQAVGVPNGMFSREVSSVLSAIDANGDGQVSWPEFLAAMSGTEAVDAPKYRTFEDAALDHPSEDIGAYYTLGRQFARGGFSTVHTAKHKATRELVAVKRLSKVLLAGEMESIRKEIQILYTLQGYESCVSLLDVFEDETSVYLVMELCTGGSLTSLVKARGNAHSESEASTLLAQMLDAVETCHQLGIIHRDIKPDNFLLASMDGGARLKCADFGISVFCGAGGSAVACGTAAGTEEFMAPELARVVLDGGEGTYTHAVDIWGCGVVLYVLLSGVVPFVNARDICSSPLEFPQADFAGVSAAARDLLRQMLDKDPAKRLTIAQVREHGWMSAAPTQPLEHALLRRLQSFGRLDVMKSAALKAISMHLAAEEIAGLRRTFEAFDLDGDGRVTAAELGTVLARQGQVVAAEQLQGIVASLGVGAAASGGVLAADFVAAITSPQKLQHKHHLALAFEHFDADRDGRICGADVHGALAGTGGLDAAEVVAAMARVDGDGDGFISWTEFLSLFAPGGGTSSSVTTTAATTTTTTTKKTTGWAGNGARACGPGVQPSG